MCYIYTRALYQRRGSIAIMERVAAKMSLSIRVLPRTLLVLCGPAGSGKSTFAAQRFGATTVVSSDHCRALICDDANNQQVNRDTFDLFYFIIKKRLFLGRLTRPCTRSPAAGYATWRAGTVTRRACSSSIFHRRHARDGTRDASARWKRGYCRITRRF